MQKGKLDLFMTPELMNKLTPYLQNYNYGGTFCRKIPV